MTWRKRCRKVLHAPRNLDPISITHPWMSNISPADEYAMRIALDQALNAQLAGEVPVAPW